MYIIRPIQQSDYPALYAIAVESGIGFTSLPVNESLLQRKIDRSTSSFGKDVSEPHSESYLFVMEDVTTGEVVGTAGIEAAVGTDDAFYHYHVGKVVHASRELNIHNTVEILTFCNDYTGVSEICTLFLRESARKGLNGRFLSKVRFLFMQEHRERFADTVIAEMRGVSDENGRSPFWEWLEAHFFSMDFPTADYLTGIGNKVFIAELMPKYPIYVNLLSQDAQNVIGKVHKKTEPALRLLQEEGFIGRGYVDIFDGGPTVEANLSHIRTAQRSRRATVHIDDQSAAQDGELCYIINTSVKGFRAVVADVQYDSQADIAVISHKAAAALNVDEGGAIRFAAVTPRD
ncbi:arginine N-succinyltransferase [Aestuariibacter sp. GS-14]|uniref:arginine N-succinyltransferase n=1 Tax=Alteromonadaceae TaxID=72275 RepID=UPI001128A390|nr:arginine N-succinyltransferase [Aestuariibacter sp. GS-14]TPV58414.1 arginine N-succinyltransferase [Aestuariibacter sp. GS-14]